MSKRLVKMSAEFRVTLKAGDPRGDFISYPRGWQGWVPAETAKQIVAKTAGRDVTPEGDGAEDAEADAAALKKQISAAKRAVTKAEKALSAIREEIGEGEATLEQAAQLTAAEAELKEAEVALAALEG